MFQGGEVMSGQEGIGFFCPLEDLSYQNTYILVGLSNQ